MSHPNDLAWTNNSTRRQPLAAEDDTLFDEARQSIANEQTLDRAQELVATLQQKLNQDVARLIVLEAGLTTLWRERQRPANALSIMELNSPQPCFISHQIKKASSVRRVDFRIDSHDQGWVTHRDGTSWSWFDACVIPVKQLDIGGRSIGGSATDRVWDIEYLDTQSREPISPYHKAHEISQTVQRERDLCRNTIAGRDFETHLISFSADSDDPVEANWIRSLQDGERIMVRAWARYGGWSNHVRSVSVTIHTDVFI